MRSMFAVALVFLTAGLAPAATTPPTLPELRNYLAGYANPGSYSYVDNAAGLVVVRMPGTPTAAFSQQVAAVGGGRVRVDAASPVSLMSGTADATALARPAVAANALYGGMPMRDLNTDLSKRKICTTGFLADDTATGYLYVLTAGHCVKGEVNPWFLHQGYPAGPELGLGVVTSIPAEPRFPFDDFGRIKVTNTGLNPGGVVVAGTGTRRITGFGDAQVGITLCSNAAVGGFHCGQVLSTDGVLTIATSPFRQTVDGLVETNICAMRGDSGSPLFSYTASDLRSTGYGMLSGGTVCVTGGYSRAYYQPLREVLDRFHLRLYPVN